MSFAGGKRIGLVVDQLLGVPHQRQHHGVANHFERGEVLRLAQHDGGDADAFGLPDGFAQERVGALAALGGNEVIGGLEEAIVDFVRLHEAADVDGPGLLERGRAEVFLGQDDEAALLVFVSLDQFFPRDGLALAGADTLELHRRLVVDVKHAEARA